MDIAERIRYLQEARKLPEVVPSIKLQKVLAKSRVETLIEKLPGLKKVEVNKELIEGGKKMVIVARWPTQDERIQNQLIISVREDSVSFIGDTPSNQYLRMEGTEISNRDLAEEYLARTFVNPSKINVGSKN